MAINAQEIQGQWNRLRGQVKEKWGQLTDDDLQIHGGNIDQLVGKIQQRTGEGREAIEKFLTDLTSKGGSAVSQAASAVGNFAHTAGDRFRDQYGNFTEGARERFDATQDLVRHNPTQSIAAAFGVGLVARPDRRARPSFSLGSPGLSRRGVLPRRDLHLDLSLKRLLDDQRSFPCFAGHSRSRSSRSSLRVWAFMVWPEWRPTSPSFSPWCSWFSSSWPASSPGNRVLGGPTVPRPVHGPANPTASIREARLSRIGGASPRGRFGSVRIIESSRPSIAALLVLLPRAARRKGSLPPERRGVGRLADPGSPATPPVRLRASARKTGQSPGPGPPSRTLRRPVRSPGDTRGTERSPRGREAGPRRARRASA